MHRVLPAAVAVWGRWGSGSPPTMVARTAAWGLAQRRANRLDRLRAVAGGGCAFRCMVLAGAMLPDILSAGRRMHHGPARESQGTGTAPVSGSIWLTLHGVLPAAGARSSDSRANRQIGHGCTARCQPGRSSFDTPSDGHVPSSAGLSSSSAFGRSLFVPSWVDRCAGQGGIGRNACAPVPRLEDVPLCGIE